MPTYKTRSGYHTQHLLYKSQVHFITPSSTYTKHKFSPSGPAALYPKHKLHSSTIKTRVHYIIPSSILDTKHKFATLHPAIL